MSETFFAIIDRVGLAKVAHYILIAMATLFWPGSPAFAACTPATPCVMAPMDLGTFGGATSVARGVNSDGSVVVGDGSTTSNLPHAFRWTSAGGLQDLGTLGCSFSFSEGMAVNADGSVIVGNSFDTGCANHAFRWTSAGGMQGIGTLGGDFVSQGVNADGSVVVGYAGVGGNAVIHAFHWTGGVMSDLGTLGGQNSFGWELNGDGSVVVGWSNTTGNTAFFTGVHAYRWTSAGGFQDLGTLGGSDSFAYAASSDGSVIVGRADSGGGSLPFRWTSAGGMQGLGSLGGSNPSAVYNGCPAPCMAALDVSADGSVVVGQSATSTGDVHAFRWTAAVGMRDLNALLAAAGVNMTGITLVTATGVSSNGFIVGQGNFPSGANHAYIVRFDDGTGSHTFTKDDCKDGGWMSFTSSPGPFKNQGQCVSYFAHQK